LDERMKRKFKVLSKEEDLLDYFDLEGLPADYQERLRPVVESSIGG